jgi:hypothetical protein
MKRVGLFLVALAIAFGGSFGPAKAMSVGKYYEFRYYSDSGHNNLVGVAGEYCDQTTYSWGYPDDYSTYETWAC